jgi:hypothetical protein
MLRPRVLQVALLRPRVLQVALSLSGGFIADKEGVIIIIIIIFARWLQWSFRAGELSS